jgi:hypothetical protein
MRRLFLLFAICVSFASRLQAGALEEHYFAALKAIDVADWETAIAELKASYTAKPHSLTAYLAAYSCAQIFDFEATAAWARLALRGAPPLKEIYRKDAAKLWGWATAARPAIRARFELSKDPKTQVPDYYYKPPEAAEIDVPVPATLASAFSSGAMLATIDVAACSYPMGIEGFNQMIADSVQGKSCMKAPSVLVPATESQANRLE